MHTRKSLVSTQNPLWHLPESFLIDFAYIHLLIPGVPEVRCVQLKEGKKNPSNTLSDKAKCPVLASPLSESDRSEETAEPRLSLRILSVAAPACSFSRRTRSSCCSQRRRPFSSSARSACSCSFCNQTSQKHTGVRGGFLKMKGNIFH